MLEGSTKYQNDPFKSINNNIVRYLGGIADFRTFGH
jgi:hypothetical protein